MSKLDDIRAKYPGAYDDMSDAELANALYSTHYSDMDRTEFDAAIGTAKGAEPGISQQLFDVKNAKTGESYLYGNTPAPAPYEDLQRTVADTVSRGYLDKLRGPEAQARTEAARQRMPDWVETPTDIATAVVASPYRIAGMGAGAAWGGLEGAASAYGHQKDWVPDWQGTKDIAWSTGKGAVLGAVGTKVGEKVGDWWGGRQAEKAQPYKTDAELQAANKAETAKAEADYDAGTSDRPFTETSQDLAARADRLAKVRAVQGSGNREELAKMLAGMTPKEAEMAAKIGGKSLTTAAGELADATGKGLNLPLLAIETLAGHGIPWKTLTGIAAKTAVSKAGKSDWANKIPPKALEPLAALTRDPRGIGTVADPATIQAARDAAAKAFAGYGKTDSSAPDISSLPRILFGERR